MTVAVTQAIFNALDKDARTRWERQRGRATRTRQPEAAQTVEAFRSNLDVIAAMFPGAVKVH